MAVCGYVENIHFFYCRYPVGCFELTSIIKRHRMNALLLRTAAIVLHAAANFLFVTFLLNYDISGSWLAFLGFIVLLLFLLFLFLKHALSYIYFLKTKTK